MSVFPECLLIVSAEVDAAIEGEWNRWYDTVHLPDALRCPGVRRGRRYVSSGEVSETARTPSRPQSSAPCAAGTSSRRMSARARR
jgi:hypothetical protein